MKNYLIANFQKQNRRRKNNWGKVTKITNKYIFLFIPGLKSEPVIDVNEIKMIGMSDDIKEGSSISVLLEKIEDKNGDVIVSAHKAQKLKGGMN